MICSLRRLGRAGLVVVGLTLLAPARAQVLDPSFYALDSRAAFANAKGPTVRALATDPAGRVLVSGAFNLLNNQPHGGVGRLLASGQPDPTFGASGVGANGLVDAIVPLANGQYLVAGTFTRYDGQSVGHVARLNANGTVDASFNVGVGADAQVLALAVDGQGRSYVGGWFEHFNGQPAPGLVRLLPSGALDPTFAPALIGDQPTIYALDVDANGNVLAGGFSYTNTTQYYLGLLQRLLPTGANDPTFVTAPLDPDDWVIRLRVLPSGKVLAGGYLITTPGAGTGESDGIRRLNPDGSTDPTFTSPFASYPIVRDMVSLPSGHILVVGSGLGLIGATTSKRVWRLQADGTPDVGFTPPTFTGSTYALTTDAAGGVLVGGSFLTVGGQPQPGLARLTNSGFLDPSFSLPSLQEYATIHALGRQSGDRLVAVGNFGTISSQSQPPVVRFTPTGTLDPTFQLDPTISLNQSNFGVYSPLIIGQGDRILLADNQHTYRLLANGTRDPAFDDGAGVTQTSIYAYGPYGISEQPDGRVLVWGSFTQYNQTSRANLVRLTATGAVDPSFVPPPDSFSSVRSFVLLPNGTMLAAYNSNTLRWLDASGTPLASFNGGAPLDGIYSVRALPDTTVLVSGSFTLNGTTYDGTYKLTAAGTVDPGFALASGLSGTVVQAQPSGLLLFRESRFSSHRLRRLLPSGTLDPSFMPVEFGTGYITESDQTWVFQSNGDLVVGGGFTTINGVQRPTLARLTNIPTGLAADVLPLRAFDLFPNPARTTLTLRRSSAETATATLLDVLGRPVRRWSLTAAEQQVSLAGVPAGTYVVRVATDKGNAATQRVVVQP